MRYGNETRSMWYGNGTRVLCGMGTRLDPCCMGMGPEYCEVCERD